MKTFSEIYSSGNLKTFSFVFFNLGNQIVHNDGNTEYEISIEYRVSKFSSMIFTPDIAEFNNKLLKDYTNIDFKISTQTDTTIRHQAILLNDTNLSRQQFLYNLYARIEQTRFTYANNKFEEIIISSFFVPRGSIDLNRNYFTVDVLKQNVSEEYVQNLLSILTSLSAIKQLNFNFRELQPEYLEGKNRNAQLRINLRWFYDKYINNLEYLNYYKFDLLKSNHKEIMIHTYNNNLSSSFIERAIFYKDKIIGQQDQFNKLSKKQLNNIVKDYRNELNFDENPTESDIVYRDRSIIKLAIITQPDVCHSCHEDYDINDRTFTMRGSKRPYLEIHHVISFGADNDGDVLQNLVKLCPSCHRALTPNRAEEQYQKRIISNILSTSENAYEYVRLFINESASREDAIDFVYTNLM